MRRQIELIVKADLGVAVVLTNQLKDRTGGIYIMPQFHKYDMVAEIIEAVR